MRYYTPPILTLDSKDLPMPVTSKYQDKNVAFICASGARSKIITDYLINKGYKNIYHIPDGIMGKQNDGWLFNGYPLINYNNMKEK